MINTLPPASWFVAGEAPRRPTALVEINVTRGTNSAAQKEEFVKEAYAELEAQLGGAEGLELASYVVVNEVEAANWGYGGRTQLDRKQHQ
jgi:4-oxalocrotonate tautomerase